MVIILTSPRRQSCNPRSDFGVIMQILFSDVYLSEESGMRLGEAGRVRPPLGRVSCDQAGWPACSLFCDMWFCPAAEYEDLCYLFAQRAGPCARHRQRFAVCIGHTLCTAREAVPREGGSGAVSKVRRVHVGPVPYLEYRPVP